MTQEEFEIRQEIALRIWRETLIPGETIARWTGLSGEQVRTLVKGVRRLEGRWEDLSDVMYEEEEAFLETGRGEEPE